MRIIEIKVYTINEHPMKSLCFDWMRENLHDLNEHSVQEVKDSIEALSEAIGGTNDYGFGSQPMRGEFVKFKGYSVKALMDIDAEEMTLTGCWTDFRVIKALQESPSFEDEEGNLICYPVGVLDDLHDDTDFTYSDEGLEEYADMSEFEFTTKGELI